MRAVVSTMSSSPVSVSFPLRVPRKGGHGEKSGGEPHGENEICFWLIVATPKGAVMTVYGGSVRSNPAQLVTERGRAEPAHLRHIEHDVIRSGPLHLDVAFCLRPDAERLLDVVTAS